MYSHPHANGRPFLMVQGPSGSQQYTPGQQAAAPPGQETITYAAYQPQTHTFVSQQHQPYPQVPAQEPVQAFSSMLMGTIERTIERVERGVLDNMRRLDTTHRDRQTILDNNVQELQKNILVSRDQAHEETRQVAKWIEASHAFHVKALCQVQERMDTLQRSVGTLSAPIALESEDSEQPAEKSLTERMDRIECLLYELLEKSNDPDASKPVVEMRDMGTSPHVEPEPVKVFLDVDTQTVTAAHHDAIVGPSVPPAVYADANTSPLEIEQTDFGVGPRTPEPEELDVAPPTTPRAFERFQSRFPSSPFRPELMRPAEWLREVALRDADSQSSGSRTPSDIASRHPTRPSSITSAVVQGVAPRDQSLPTLSSRRSSPLGPPTPEFGLTVGQLRSQVFADESHKHEELLPPSRLPTDELQEPIDRSLFSPLASEPQEYNEELPPSSPPIDTLSDRQVSAELDTRTRSSSATDFLAEAMFNESLAHDPPFHSPEFARDAPLADQNQQNPTGAFAGMLFRDRSHTRSPPGAGSRKRSRSESERSDLSELSSLTSLSTPTTSVAPTSRRADPPAPVSTLSIPTKRNKPSGSKPRKRRRTEPPLGRSRKKTGAGPSRSPPEEIIECDWPQKSGDCATEKDFVQCDVCDAWYHWSCVGVQRGDECLAEGHEFLCPPCTTCRDVYHVVRTIDKSKVRDDRCARPDCDHPAFIAREDEYFVERIIGRLPHDNDAKSFEYIWLVKWTGYEAIESSWSNRSAFPNADEHIKTFEEQAVREGCNPKEPYSKILLKEAILVGW